MQKHLFTCVSRFIPVFAFTIFFSLLSFIGNGQDTTVSKTDTVPVKDVGDILKKIFKKKEDSTKAPKSTGVTLLPSIGYNPSFGFIIGAKLSAIKQYGDPANTNLSSFLLEGIYTTNGVVSGQARHNIFKSGNKWNLQGNWQLSKYLIKDYGIGTGNDTYITDGDSAFLLKFKFIRLSEKIYKKIGSNLFAGVGLSFDMRKDIEDKKLEKYPNSPHSRYSERNGIDPTKYNANGILVALQYNTREHPIRSYGGVYIDLNFRVNQTWLGSTKNSSQVFYDLRKYFSLSRKNPEHVLAFWHWANYKLGGTLPYLELPATAYDTYARSGRAYTMGRFKGPEYACFESEYRFPISRNKLISGVAFVNLQSASDDLDKKVFQYWETAVGGGLRILFSKASRSTICIDYARGNYESSGFFFGLNEVF